MKVWDLYLNKSVCFMIKYLVKIFYANEDIAKYGVSRWKYTMALISTSFYILVTLLFLTIVLFAISPEIYKIYLRLDTGVNSKIWSVIIFLTTFLFLRIMIPESTLANVELSKKKINKSINFLLFYIISIGIIMVIVGLKYLRTVKS